MQEPTIKDYFDKIKTVLSEKIRLEGKRVLLFIYREEEEGFIKKLLKTVKQAYPTFLVKALEVKGLSIKELPTLLELIEIESVKIGKEVSLINPKLGSYPQTIHHKQQKMTINTQILQSKVAQTLLDLAAQTLAIEPSHISIEAEFGTYGFSSISLTQFAEAINEDYNINLVPTIFYSYPTIEKLTTFLMMDAEASLRKKHALLPTEVRQNNLEKIIAQSLDNGITPKETHYLEAQKVNQPANEPIAIIGMSGRLPSSPNLTAFWENLEANKDLVTEVPLERWDWQAYYGNDKADKRKLKVKWGGFISDADKFDSLHFNISPREAELMDPQHRIALEEVYHALEDAGINPKSLSGTNAGIFLSLIHI